MVSAISHVRLAIFNPAGFSTQWVPVLSANELFQCRVFCSTVGATVNGWQEIWMECDSSPASFNRAATFAGVIHVAASEILQGCYRSIETEPHCVEIGRSKG